MRYLLSELLLTAIPMPFIVILVFLVIPSHLVFHVWSLVLPHDCVLFFLLVSSPVCCISSRTSRWMHFRLIYAQYSWITATQLLGWTWEPSTSPATSLRMPSNATLMPPAANPALMLLLSLPVLNAYRYWPMSDYTNGLIFNFIWVPFDIQIMFKVFSSRLCALCTFVYICIQFFFFEYIKCLSCFQAFAITIFTFQHTSITWPRMFDFQMYGALFFF